MKKSQHNSSTSLFLMEMILALLFLSLCSAACIQIFAAAHKNRIQAEQWNQIQALTTSVGEALEGSNGSPKQLLALLPDGTQTDNSLIWYYDHSWQNCSRDEADYEMVFVLSTTSSEKSGELSFRNIPENTLLYQITLIFLTVAPERRKSIETKTYFFRNSRNSFAVSDLFRTLPLCTGFAYSFQFTDQFNNSQTFHGTDREILFSLQ